MQAKLSLGAARALLPALFHELAKDGTIDRAVSVGRAALREGDAWWVPALWLRLREGRLWAEDAPAPPPLPSGISIGGNVGTVQVVPVSGGQVGSIIGSQHTYGAPPASISAASGQAEAIGQAAVSMGLGGIGKTDLASEFVHRYGAFFAGGVFWISFADPASVPVEIAACGAALDLPGFADLKLDDQVARVRAAWAQPVPRLLVFDNCDDSAPGQAEALIQQWKPATGGCRVLITSRRGTWSKSLGLTALPLGVLSRAESIAFLRKHRPDLAEDGPPLDVLTGNRPPPWAGPPTGTPPPASPEADEEEFFAEGEPLTPTMRALLQIAGCLERQAPIPLALLIAPLPPHAGPGAPEALVALGLGGWLSAPSLTTAQLTPKGRAFLAANPPEEPLQRTVIQALCGLLGEFMRERDEAMLRLVEPHLTALADAWAVRDDDHALMLCLGAGTYLTLFGNAARARPYLDRAKELDAAFGGSSPKPGRTRRGRR